MAVEARLKVGLGKVDRAVLEEGLEACCHLHPFNIKRAMFENQIMNAAIAVSQWDIALIAAQRSTRAFHHLYPPLSPVPALQSSIAGKLCWRVGRKDEGIVYLQRAIGRLQVTHGMSHTLVSALVDILNELSHGEG